MDSAIAKYNLVLVTYISAYTLYKNEYTILHSFVTIRVTLWAYDD